MTCAGQKSWDQGQRSLGQGQMSHIKKIKIKILKLEFFFSYWTFFGRFYPFSDRNTTVPIW